MKDHGENDDSVPSSKRLRLSIQRSHRYGSSSSHSEAPPPLDGVSTSSNLNLLDLTYIDPTGPDESCWRHCSQDSPHCGNDIPGYSVPANEESISLVIYRRQFHTSRQLTVRGSGHSDNSHDHVDAFEDQDRALRNGELHDGTSDNMWTMSAGLGAELPVMRDDPIDPAQEHDVALQLGEAGADDVLESIEISGAGPANDALEQEIHVSDSGDVDPEARPFGPQEHDEMFFPGALRLGLSGSQVSRHVEALETNLEVLEPVETESASLSAQAQNQVAEVIEVSEDDREVESADLALTASAFTGLRQTPEDIDAFAPEPRLHPQRISEGASLETRTLRSEQCGTQLDSDGTMCPICMESWTNTGNHRICSLACGHLFGKSCIKRWLKQAGRKQGKCPQCNEKARVEELRTLYVPRLAVIDGEGLQEIVSLRNENERLKQQVTNLQVQLRRFMHASSLGPPRMNRQIAEQQNFRNFHEAYPSERDSFARRIVGPQQRREESNAGRSLRSFTSETSAGRRGSQCTEFVLQGVRPLHGAKAFDMDAHSQLLLISGKPPDSTTSSGLTKMSFLALSEGESMNLPPGTGAIRDIRIAPSGTRAPGRLALVASLGKKLTLFSLESNNVVITYTLPNPSWACAWDPCDPNRVYTGLQNGTLLTFDMRQTSSPISSLKGPSSSPVHTLVYVPDKRTIINESTSRGGRGLLSASSSTLLFWPDVDQPAQDRPVCLSQPGGSSVCVSTSYNAAFDVMVASFRPKPTTVPINGSASSSTRATHSQIDVSSQPTSSVLSETASTTSVSVQIPTHFSYVRKPRLLSEIECSVNVLGVSHAWEQQGAMVGHKSQMVLSRTAIVKEWGDSQPSQSGTSAGEDCLFASGDEGSNSVWLWDIGTKTVRQTLTPHPYSPVLDIRTANIAGEVLLGCMSERTLQLYRRAAA